MRIGSRCVSALLSLLLLASLSCTRPEEKPKEDIQAAKTETDRPSDFKARLEAANRELEKAALNGEYETILRYYTDDVVLAPEFHQLVRGKAAVRELYQKMRELGVRYHSFNASAEEISVCGREVIEYGTFGLSVSSREKKRPAAYTGSYCTIWEQQEDESYLMKYVISNLNFNPCAD
jgi:ketosteroid isomerase-like protein